VRRNPLAEADALPDEIVAAILDEHRARFERGHKAELLYAIRLCLDQRVVAPEWVVDAFARAMRKWGSFDVRTLDEAFGVEWPKGKSIAAARKRWRLALAARLAVSEARRAGRAVDDELFEEIGRRLGVGKTLVKEYLATARAVVERPRALDALLAPFVVRKPQRRKK
jgi:hypothetical protein